MHPIVLAVFYILLFANVALGAGLSYPGGITTQSPAGCVKYVTSTNPKQFQSTALDCHTANAIQTKTFAQLGSPADGTTYYCSDCTQVTPCAGSGTGAFAQRVNGAWACNSGGSDSFSAITSGTNTNAAMVVGNGATLSATGTGVIEATKLPATSSLSCSSSPGKIIALTGGAGNLVYCDPDGLPSSKRTALGDSSGNALTGDNAASFFGAGTLELARGGTNQSSWTPGTCVQVNAGGTALESAGAACGSGGGSGDVTDVGPGCATGACFTDGVATTGTTMFVWEGTSADANEFILAAPSANPGADVTVTFPSVTGTLASLAASQTFFGTNTFGDLVRLDDTSFLTGVATDGVTWDPTTKILQADDGTLRANDVVCGNCIAGSDVDESTLGTVPAASDLVCSNCIHGDEIDESLLVGVVFTTSDQTIAGAKTFTTATQFNSDVYMLNGANGAKFTNSTNTLAAFGASGIVEANSVACGSDCISTAEIATNAITEARLNSSDTPSAGQCVKIAAGDTTAFEYDTCGVAEVADQTYNAGNFDGDTTTGVSQDDLYDQLHLGDADDDGLNNALENTVTLGISTDASASLTVVSADANDMAILFDDSLMSIGSNGTPSVTLDDKDAGNTQDVIWRTSCSGSPATCTVDHLRTVSGSSVTYISTSGSTVTLGHASNASVTIATNSTGNGELVVPDNSINLTTGAGQEVTGTLPVGNGGTGATSLTDLITLSTHTTGNYVASITNGSGITGGNDGSEGAALTLAATLGTDIVTGEIVDGTIAFADVDATATLAGNPANGANSVWLGTTGLIAEGSTSDTIETLLTFADPTSNDKTVTIPDETGTVCTTGSVCSGYQAGPLSGDVVTSGATATIQLNSVALTTDTTGNYVTSITNGSGITGGDGGSEGAALTIAATLGTDIVTGEIVDGTITYADVNATQTLAGNPNNGASSVWFATTGLIFEGATAGADNNEGLLISSDVTGDRTWTLPDETGTLCTNTSVCSLYESETHASEHQDGGADEIAVTAGMVNTGTGASATTFFRGDNTWSAIDGGSGGEITDNSIDANDLGLGLTTDGIVFSNSSGDPTNNGSFVWDNTNKRIGIVSGTPTTVTPETVLDIWTDNNTDTTTRQLRTTYHGTANTGGFIRRRGRGTIAAPTKILSGDSIASDQWHGYFDDGAGAVGYAAGVTTGANATEDWNTAAAKGTLWFVNTVPTGGGSLTRSITALGGKIGIGPNATTPSSRLDVIEATAGSSVEKLSTVIATYDDPSMETFQGANQTTAAATVTIATIATPSGKVCLFEIKTVGRCVSGSSCDAGDPIYCHMDVVATNAAGTLTESNQTDIKTYADAAGNAVNSTCNAAGDVTASGANLLVSATGVANETITWHTTVEMQCVSS